ncbi:MAG: Ig-like domain-containing protein [Roseburia sp.]|nr:Ig-like domain-containing protein [Roseburia sp.]
MHHGRIGTRILAALLCAMLSIGSVQTAPQQVWAAEQQNAVTTYATNNQADEAFSFALENGKFVVQSVPYTEQYSYIWVVFNDASQILPISSVVEFPLPSQDGTYYVDIYLGKERYATYKGVIFGENIGVTIQGGAASFVESPVYKRNLKVFQSGSTSATMRGYYTQPSHWVESDSPKIKALAKKIVNDSDSDYEKVKKVHDWVADNIWYDYDAYYSGTSAQVDAVKVLEVKRTVCQGYADLTAALLRSLGIPTKVVSGYALGVGTSGGWTKELVSSKATNHAWNEAYVDGRWIILDTTWDSDNKYQNGTFSQGTGLKYRKYFDPTLEFFSADHKIFEEDSYDKWERENAFSSALSVSKTSLTLKKGKTKQLSVKTSQSYIKLKDAKITYSSSNKKVATVSSKGKIKAKKAGQTTITTTVKLEGITFKFRTQVTVKK